MASPSTTSSQFSDDLIWNSLKQAIANSSGFRRWQSERELSALQTQNSSLEQQVSWYLRETLETLAY